jgi:hypothetical protein
MGLQLRPLGVAEVSAAEHVLTQANAGKGGVVLVVQV